MPHPIFSKIIFSTPYNYGFATILLNVHINICMIRDNFVKWLRFSKNPVIEEGVWGNWTYEIPDDKKEQLYDFYMLEYLLPHGVQLHLTPFFFGNQEDQQGEKDTETGKIHGEPSKTIEDKFSKALYEVADKLLPHLKKELLDVVYFSLGAELKHVWDTHHNQTNQQAIFKTIKNELGPEYARMLKQFTINYHVITNNSEVKKLLPRPNFEPVFSSSEESHKKSNHAMRAAGGTPEQWATLLQWLFNNEKQSKQEKKTPSVTWSSAYGGPAWGRIAEGWLLLYHAKTVPQMIAYIDHIYDLEHNTGSVFTKVLSYAKDYGYTWVKEALDHKRDLTSPHEMMEHVSHKMRDLALIGIKLKTGKTWQDLEDNWPEFLEKKTNVHNQNKQLEWEKKREERLKKAGNIDNFISQYGPEPQDEKGKLEWNKKKEIWIKALEDNYIVNHGKPPKPITPGQYEANHIRPSKHPWSLYQFTSQYKAEQQQQQKAMGGSNVVPDINKIKPGDQVSKEWPPREWYTVSVIKQNDWGVKSLVLSGGGGLTPFEYIKGYKSKEEAAKAPKAPAPAPTPAAPAPSTPAYPYGATTGEYKDSAGNILKIGDMVTKPGSNVHKNEAGTVTKLNPDGYSVNVKWPSYSHEKSYYANLLLVTKSEGPLEVPKEIKPGDKVTIQENPSTSDWYTVSYKNHSGVLIVTSPSGVTHHINPLDVKHVRTSVGAPSPTLDLSNLKPGDEVAFKEEPLPYDWYTFVSKDDNGNITVSNKWHSVLTFYASQVKKIHKKSSVDLSNIKSGDKISPFENPSEDDWYTYDSTTSIGTLAVTTNDGKKYQLDPHTIKSFEPTKNKPSENKPSEQELKDLKPGDKVATVSDPPSDNYWFTVIKKSYGDAIDAMGQGGGKTIIQLKHIKKIMKGPGQTPEKMTVTAQELKDLKPGDKVAITENPTEGQWYNVTKIEGDNISVKHAWGLGQDVFKSSQIKKIKKNTKDFEFKPTSTDAKEIYESLPKMPHALKLARTVRGMKTMLSFNQAFDELEKSLGISVSAEERKNAQTLYHEENEKINYYKSRGHLKFPKGLSTQQAWDTIQQKFPNPPHVYVDPESDKEINSLLKQHDNAKATSLLIKVTQFDLPSAKGLIVLKKLELYMDGEITE